MVTRDQPQSYDTGFMDKVIARHTKRRFIGAIMFIVSRNPCIRKVDRQPRQALHDAFESTFSV